MNKELLKYLLMKPKEYMLLWTYLYAASSEKGVTSITTKEIGMRFHLPKGTLKRILDYPCNAPIGGMLITRRWNGNTMIINFKQFHKDVKNTTIKKGLDFAVMSAEAQHWINQYIKNNLPNVSSIMQQPTPAQCVQLETAFSEEMIIRKLKAMENYRVGKRTCDMLYSTVYYTLQEWCKKEQANTPLIIQKPSAITRHANNKTFNQNGNANARGETKTLESLIMPKKELTQKQQMENLYNGALADWKFFLKNNDLPEFYRSTAVFLFRIKLVEITDKDQQNAKYSNMVKTELEEQRKNMPAPVSLPEHRIAKELDAIINDPDFLKNKYVAERKYYWLLKTYFEKMKTEKKDFPAMLKKAFKEFSKTVYEEKVKSA